MSKVIVSGRGGSGKSTLTALLAARLAPSAAVLVVDADESNTGLPLMLGLASPPQTVMQALGGKSAVRDRLLASLREEASELPPLFADRTTVEEIPASCVVRRDGLSFARIGKIEHSMEGCACPMGAAARSFVSQLDIAPDDWLLVDTEAGVEHFGRGLVEGVDVVLTVVDPSHEAVMTAARTARLAREAGKPLVLALNNADERSAAVLRDSLAARGLEPAASIPPAAEVAGANLVGAPLPAASLGQCVDGLIAALRAVAHQTPAPVAPGR